MCAWSYVFAGERVVGGRKNTTGAIRQSCALNYSGIIRVLARRRIHVRPREPVNPEQICEGGLRTYRMVKEDSSEQAEEVL